MPYTPFNSNNSNRAMHRAPENGQFSAMPPYSTFNPNNINRIMHSAPLNEPTPTMPPHNTFYPNNGQPSAMPLYTPFNSNNVNRAMHRAPGTGQPSAMPLYTPFNSNIKNETAHRAPETGQPSAMPLYTPFNSNNNDNNNNNNRAMKRAPETGQPSSMPLYTPFNSNSNKAQHRAPVSDQYSTIPVSNTFNNNNRDAHRAIKTEQSSSMPLSHTLNSNDSKRVAHRTSENDQPSTMPLYNPFNSYNHKAMHRALENDEIISLIGSRIPLFELQVLHNTCDPIRVWDPRPLMRCTRVSRRWRRVLLPILWGTYDFQFMNEVIPAHTLADNMHRVRRLSLMDLQHKKYADLWSALSHLDQLTHLELHYPIFPVKKLFGNKPPILRELLMSGSVSLVHPFLLVFLERQTDLRTLEITRMSFTKDQWTAVMSGKDNLQKLSILRQTVIQGYEDPQPGKKGAAPNVGAAVKAESAGAAAKTEPASATVKAEPASVSAVVKAEPAVVKAEPSSATGSSALVATTESSSSENADFGPLPIKHLCMLDNQLSQRFHRTMLIACPRIEHLEICHVPGSDGVALAHDVTRFCPKVKALTIRSNDQTWAGAMIGGMPAGLERLDVQLKSLGNLVSPSILGLKDSLTSLVLDLGVGTKSAARRTLILLTILRECQLLKEVDIHDHSDDATTASVLFSKPWNLPWAKTIKIHGIQPRSTMSGDQEQLVPHVFRRAYTGRQHDCCSAKVFTSTLNMNTPVMPAFDLELLRHVLEFPSLAEVVISETTYRKTI